MFAAFSHQLEGADPSSNEAYPRVIVPAPRPSEGPGSAIVRGRLDTAFRDIFFSFSMFGRVTGTPGTIFGGEGAYIAPSGREGSAKKSSFSLDFQRFRGWDSGVLLLFCFYFDCAYVVFFPGKLVFFADFCLFGEGFGNEPWDRDSGVVGRIALTLKCCCFCFLKAAKSKLPPS